MLRMLGLVIEVFGWGSGIWDRSGGRGAGVKCKEHPQRPAVTLTCERISYCAP